MAKDFRLLAKELAEAVEKLSKDHAYWELAVKNLKKDKQQVEEDIEMALARQKKLEERVKEIDIERQEAEKSLEEYKQASRDEVLKEKEEFNESCRQREMDIKRREDELKSERIKFNAERIAYGESFEQRRDYIVEASENAVQSQLKGVSGQKKRLEQLMLEMKLKAEDIARREEALKKKEIWLNDRENTLKTNIVSYR